MYVVIDSVRWLGEGLFVAFFAFFCLHARTPQLWDRIQIIEESVAMAKEPTKKADEKEEDNQDDDEEEESGSEGDDGNVSADPSDDSGSEDEGPTMADLITGKYVSSAY